jgi:two-component system NarL family sensor kinase
MRYPLLWIRYILVLVPAVSTLYIMNITTYTHYTLYILLLLWMIQLRKRIPRSIYYAGIIPEALYIGWLNMLYGGLLFAAIYSTLVSIYENHRVKNKAFFVIVLILVLNASLLNMPPFIWIFANLLFAAFTILLHYVHSTVGHNENIEILNDELRQKHYELDAAKARLTEYSKEVQQIAQMEERNRISREIHDDLGHKLIRLKMMLEAIVQIMPHQQDKGMQMIVQVRDQLTESIESLRTTVRRMKPAEKMMNSYSLSRLIDDFGADCGIKVDYKISGTPYTLYPSEEFILYRNAQEAMTNALRHGQATEVYIHMHYGAEAIEFSVINNGALPESIARKGLGLSGMEERVQLLDGKLTIDYTNQFKVTTLLPRQGNTYESSEGRI